MIALLLFGDNFKALLDEHSQIYDDLVGGSADLVILEEYISAELCNGFINHVIRIRVSLGGGALSLGLQRQNSKTTYSGILCLVVEGGVVGD